MKKIKLCITLIIMLLLVVSLSNISNAAEDYNNYGKVTPIDGVAELTEGNGTENVVLQFNNLDLSWAKKEDAGGKDNERYKNGWWIGIKVEAPKTNFTKETAVLQRKQYGESWSENISFDTYKDGDDYINLYAYLDNDILANEKDVFTLYEAKFDWKNDNTFEQNITIKINPKGSINLKTEDPLISKIHVVDLGIGATQTKKTFTMEKDKTLAEGLSKSEKDSFDAYKKIAGFVEFYKFTGASYDFKTDKLDSYKSNKFDPEKDKITEEEVTIVAYINNPAPVLTPTESAPAPAAPAPAAEAAPAPAGEKDNTPKTGTLEIVGYVAIITVFSAIGIVVLKNKSKNY